MHRWLNPRGQNTRQSILAHTCGPILPTVHIRIDPDIRNVVDQHAACSVDQPIRDLR
jgi:hypothetical protein